MVRTALLTILALCASSVAGCATDRAHLGRSDGRLVVVSAENIWGGIAASVGGDFVAVHNIINSPDADPHDYEPTAKDGIAVGTADLVIINGIGYDTWAQKLAAANQVRGERLLDIGDANGRSIGDNPHLWYGGPEVINTVIDELVTRYSMLDPAHADDFQRQASRFQTGPLARYDDTIRRIRSRFGGTPIGASESIVAPLAPVLGLDLVTPESFMDAVSEGAEPTVADKHTTDDQISHRRIRIYVYNSQNASPDVQAQVNLAKAHDIPVVDVTETPNPEGASFVDWQIAQLDRIERALAGAR